MVAVMKGSYWPTSGADIARSTLGYAEIGPGPMSRRAGGSMGPGIGVMLTDAPSLSSRGSPVSKSGLSCGEPAGKGCDATGEADEGDVGARARDQRPPPRRSDHRAGPGQPRPPDRRHTDKQRGVAGK